MLTLTYSPTPTLHEALELLEPLIASMTDCVRARPSARRTLLVCLLLQRLRETDGLSEALRDALERAGDDWFAMHRATLQEH